ncbi:MAG: NAD(P)H-hydrate dehydratase [Desulfobulbus sp.]|jgi:hypothetical protein
MSVTLAVAGTVPDKAFPLVRGVVRRGGDRLRIGDHEVEINRGTPALLAAALAAGTCLPGLEVHAFLVGDIGDGQGSCALYAQLERELPACRCAALSFHYLLPDVDWHARVLFAVEAMQPRPVLIADAGFMYAAKMAGQAARYDWFTPDVGELAFLADEQAPHPFYTRGFFLHQEADTLGLIDSAYRHDNAAARLLVKGSRDLVVCGGEVRAVIDQPSCPAMEAIGGTGDTLTGLLSALCASGMEPVRAATLAARANRLCGLLIDPNPATQVAELIGAIPQALARLLEE